MGTTRAEHDLAGDKYLDQRDYRNAGPTAARMLLGARLRKLRENAGISLHAAGEAIRASDSKISRLELGRTGFKQRDVADLLTMYGVTDDADRQALLSLAKAANEPGWWRRYELPGWFEPYLGLEQAASLIRIYAVQYIPDLLQTEAYARAMIRLSPYAEPEAQVEQRVALRMRRRQMLHRPAPPKLWAVIDESALRRPIGGRAAMRAQLDHLIDIAELPNISLQVVPVHSGAQPVAGGPITLLRFLEADLPDVVYLEQLISAVYLDKPSDIHLYWGVLNRLTMQAEEPDRTVRIIQQIRTET
jgi:transcriptional regulator with XRE-family HTH domain